MPQYNEYSSAAAQDTDSGDLILWEIDGVTHKMTSEEFRKVNNIAVINYQTGTSYTLLINDLGKDILMTNASANTLTVPPSSSIDFPIGTRIAVWRMGAGSTTIVAGSGVEINTANEDLAIPSQYSAGILLKYDTDKWVWSGGGAAGEAIPELSAPATLTMTAGGEDSMDFVWDDVANESGFEVQIAEDSGFTTGVQTDNVGAGVLSTSFSGLTAGTTYYGRVKAEGDGVTYSDSGYTEDSADTDPAGLVQLNDPTGFSATVDGSDVDLVWTDSNSSPNEVGYEILRNSSNTTVGATLINTTAANATSYTDTAPGAGTWYYFIRAKGDMTTTGHSAYVSDSATIAGGGYEAESEAYFAEFLTQEGSAMSTPDKDAYNDFVVAAKAAGIYSNFTFFLPLKGVTANGQKVCSINPGTTVLTYVSGTFTHTSMGLKHDGVSSSRATVPFTPTTLGGGQDDNMLGAYVTEDSTNGYDMGVGGAAAAIDYGRYGATLYSHNNAVTDNSIGSQTDSLGLTVNSRIASNEYRISRRGVNTVHSEASSGLGLGSVTILNTSVTNNSGSGRRLGCAFGGFGLSGAELTTLDGLIEDLMTAWGRNV